MTSIALTSQTVTTGYNGWCNCETGVVNSWLTNDECHYVELCAIVKNSDSADEQAEEIEQYVHWIIDIDDSSIASDLLSVSLDA